MTDNKCCSKYST